jgi:predicted RNase H-like HicB family nuclease
VHDLHDADQAAQRAFKRRIGLAVQQTMNEIVFEITQDADGGFSAECLTESIFTQGDNWEELRANVKEAVDGFYFDRAEPKHIRLHLVGDEMLETA